MTREKTEIKIVTNFNGCRGELVGTVKRTMQKRTGRGSKQRGRYNPYHVVSYKGETYRVFMLPASYGEIAGLCIDVTPEAVKDRICRAY